MRRIVGRHGSREKRVIIGLILAVGVVLAMPGPAAAVPPPPTNPSDGDIASADQEADAQLGQVGRLINQVAAADQQLRQLDDEVSAKREQVNKALVDLQNARAVVDEASAKVDNSRSALTDAGAKIDRAQHHFDQYAAQTYTQGGATTSISSFMGAGSADDVLDRSQLLQLVTKNQQTVLDGLERARTEEANRNSLARAAKAVAAEAMTEAEHKKTAAEQDIAAAQAAMDQQAARKAEIENQRNEAQAQLDAARDGVEGLEGQRAAFVAWDGQNRMAQAAQSAALAALKQAALEASERVAANLAARSRAADLANGQRPHTMLGGDDSYSTSTPKPKSGSKPKKRGSLFPSPTGPAAVETVIDRGMSQLGVRYSWGGGDENGPTLGIKDGGVADRYGDYKHIGFDCSGLMVYSFAGVGISLPHYSGYQYNAGTRVPLSQRKRGDMLFWGRNGSRHVAIYLGNDQMLEAPESGDVVKISPVRMSGIMPNAVRMIS